jgi:hypothetical protein
MIPGLSPRGVAAVVQLERTRLWPGAAHEALTGWTRFLRDPYHRRFDPQYGCHELLCCPDPTELRGVLDTVAAVLPTRDASDFETHLTVRTDSRLDTRRLASIGVDIGLRFS